MSRIILRIWAQILCKSGQGLTLSTAGLVCTKKTIIFALLQLGEKFDESTPDGREVSNIWTDLKSVKKWKHFYDQVSSLATFSDGKLTIVQTAKKAGEKSTTVNMCRIYKQTIISWKISVFSLWGRWTAPRCCTPWLSRGVTSSVCRNSKNCKI